MSDNNSDPADDEVFLPKSEGVDWARMDVDGWNMEHINAFLARR